MEQIKYHQSCYRTFTRKQSNDGQQTPTLHAAYSVAPDVQSQGDYESVKEYIEEYVFQHKQTVSISVLQSLYGLRQDSRYRSKLKT